MALDVVKVVRATWKEEGVTLYQNKRFTNLSFFDTHYYEGSRVEINTRFTIRAGKREFTRHHTIKIKADKCIISEVPSKYGGTTTRANVPFEAWKDALIQRIGRYTKNNHLREEELMDLVDDWLQLHHKKYYLKEQVEIGGRIADGFAWVGGPEGEIICFEVKADTDNYSRLYSQLDAYHMIADKMYLVIESKDPPKNLPWYVGVLKADGGCLEEINPAQSLKHVYDQTEVWQTMMKNLRKHVTKGWPKGTFHTSVNFRSIFTGLERVKKKLLYNQFCVGFRTGWSDDYVPLTQKEKQLIAKFVRKP